MSSPSSARILIADDDPTVSEALECQLQHWGYSTAASANKNELFQQLSLAEPELLLLDLYLGEHNSLELLRDLGQRFPNLVIILLTGQECVTSAVTAMKWGAFDYLSKPPNLAHLRVTLKQALEEKQLRRQLKRLDRVSPVYEPSKRLWGESLAMRRLHELIARVAPTNASALILGPNGTGKELVARSLHEQSRRRQGPFVPINMAALPRELIESALFGHEAGAFTGANQARPGCCETANGGTLFLDEIGEMGFDVQSKLLRFLQDRTVQRVGSSKTTTVDVRIIAATNRDLSQCVQEGRFREDLYYRLNVVPIQVPPLRYRREDIPLLANRFLELSAIRHSKDLLGFTTDTLDALIHYDWPGNVRQLENLVERLVILSVGPEITCDDLPVEIFTPTSRSFLPASADIVPAASDSVMPFDEVEKRSIQQALQQAQGKVQEAAKLLGRGQATIYRKLKRYGIRLQDYLSEER